MNMSHQIRQLVVREFLSLKVFLENSKNWHSFVFTALQIHIWINLLTYVSQYGRLVKSSGLSPALTVLSEVRVPTISISFISFFFDFELVYCFPVFHG